MKKRYRTLVLNGDYVPINLVSWKKAFTLILKGKAIQVEFYPNDSAKDGHGRHYAIPAVIALKRYVRRNYGKAPFSKNNLVIRDKNTCQYCGKKFKPSDLTLDHVIPKSRWNNSRTTATCWTNIVSSCFPCNVKKADKTCQASGMYPIVTPIHPSYDDIFFGLHLQGKIEPEWITWLSSLPSFKNIN